MWFRERDTWDPALILSQITVMQAGFYLLTGLWVLIFSVVFDFTPQLRMLFDYKCPGQFDDVGWAAILSSFLSAPLCSFMLLYVIGRAKKCLDFIATVYLFHFLACLFYSGFPLEWTWWGLNTLTCIGTVVFGEFLCWRKEMQEIPLIGNEESNPKKFTPRFGV